MKKLTWLFSSRAPARMSRSPQVLLRSWCQLSLLTPWYIVSNPLENISGPDPRFQFKQRCNFCQNRILNVTLSALHSYWMSVARWSHNPILLKENVIQRSWSTKIKSNTNQPMTLLVMKGYSQ